MRWQRNKFQVKEQDKTPEEELSEVHYRQSTWERLQSNDCKYDEKLRRLDTQCTMLEVFLKELKIMKNNQRWRMLLLFSP